MYQKTNHLKKRKQFNYIHSKGFPISGDYIQIKYVDTKSTCYKVGFSVSKKIGNAVTRNKIRRRLRESFRTSGLIIPRNYYFVIIAKPAILDTTFERIKTDLINSVTRMIENEQKQI